MAVMPPCSCCSGGPPVPCVCPASLYIDARTVLNGPVGSFRVNANFNGTVWCDYCQTTCTMGTDTSLHFEGAAGGALLLLVPCGWSFTKTGPHADPDPGQPPGGTYWDILIPNPDQCIILRNTASFWIDTYGPPGGWVHPTYPDWYGTVDWWLKDSLGHVFKIRQYNSDGGWASLMDAKGFVTRPMPSTITKADFQAVGLWDAVNNRPSFKLCGIIFGGPGVYAKVKCGPGPVCCLKGLLPSTVAAADGDTVSFALDASDGCAWTASADGGATVTPASGTGPATLTVTLPTPAATTTTLTVSQGATCTRTATISRKTCCLHGIDTDTGQTGIPSPPGRLGIVIDADPGCVVTLSLDFGGAAPWAHIIGPSAVTGPTTVYLAVDENSSTDARPLTVTASTPDCSATLDLEQLAGTGIPQAWCQYVYSSAWDCTGHAWGTPTLVSTSCGSLGSGIYNQWTDNGDGNAFMTLTLGNCANSTDCPAPDAPPPPPSADELPAATAAPSYVITVSGIDETACESPHPTSANGTWTLSSAGAGTWTDAGGKWILTSGATATGTVCDPGMTKWTLEWNGGGAGIRFAVCSPIGCLPPLSGWTVDMCECDCTSATVVVSRGS